MAPQTEGRLTRGGARLIAIGLPLVVIGVGLALLLHGIAVGIGAAIGLLGALPVGVGIVLAVSAGVERRSRRDRPFA